jgi:putative flippase GtrA
MQILNGAQFKKNDFWKAMAAGEGIAILALPVLNNLNFFRVISVKNSFVLPVFLIAWMIILPFSAAVGLYLVYLLTAHKWPIVFQISKYGIIGLLNTVMTAGIFNFLMLLTGVAKGLLVDVFIVVAFAITITHSFFWQKFWTFSANHTNKAKIEYVKFFSVTTATSLLNIFLLHIIINTIGAPRGVDLKVWANIAFVILIPVAFFGNFFGYKIFVFKK